MPTIKANINRITSALDRIMTHTEASLHQKASEVSEAAENRLNGMLETMAAKFEDLEEQLHKDKKKQG